MTKHDFLSALEETLSTLPQKERQERLGFYREMIDDRVEEGLSEEEAVAAAGDPEGIAAQILAEYLPEPAPQKKTRKLRTTLLLILGFPLWFSLLMAAFAVVLSVYICIWAVILSFWAVFASVTVCAVFIALAGILMAVFGAAAPGLALLGVGMVCGGLSILAYHGCETATKGTLLLTEKLLTRFMNRFKKKEAV